MDRREFLRASAALGGAAYLGGRMPWALGARTAADSILELPASEAPIDTIVVLMMENRSVDHYFGWLGRDEAYLDAGRSRYGRGFRFQGNNKQTYVDEVDAVAGVDEVNTYHLPTNAPEGPEENPYRGCHHPDPGHGWRSGRAQMAGGFLAAGSGNDEFAVGYYLADDVPLYANLARRFTTFDRYHCSVLTSTFPNREYLHSAQSGGIHTNALPPEVGHPTGFSWDTIWDRLRDDGGFVPRVDAGYFFVDLPTILLWGGRMLPFMDHIEEYFARCASGTLPKVTFIDPGFTTGLRTDDHPFADIRSGQKLVTDYVKAFAESPHWERGVLFVTYDEWGGFFDHVTPPTLPDDFAGVVPAGLEPPGFEQAGFRVPTLMVSPYAAEGFVDHRLYDHTSILRFIEWRYLGAPPEGDDGGSWALTLRDRNANNIGASLRQQIQNADIQLPLLPEVPVASGPCEGEELEGTGAPISGVPHPEAAAASYYEEHAFEKALHAGFFEQMGYDVELKPLPTL